MKRKISLNYVAPPLPQQTPPPPNLRQKMRYESWFHRMKKLWRTVQTVQSDHGLHCPHNALVSRSATKEVNKSVRVTCAWFFTNYARTALWKRGLKYLHKLTQIETFVVVVGGGVVVRFLYANRQAFSSYIPGNKSHNDRSTKIHICQTNCLIVRFIRLFISGFTLFQFSTGGNSQIYVSWTIFNQYVTSPLSWHWQASGSAISISWAPRGKSLLPVFKEFGLSRSGIEPTTSRSGGGRSNH